MLNAVAGILPRAAGHSGKNNATLEHTYLNRVCVVLSKPTQPCMKIILLCREGRVHDAITCVPLCKQAA